jgi:outer membrane lipoprotein-sorting protein
MSLAMKPRTPVALLGLALLLAACPPRPLRFGPEGEITDPDTLIRLLDRRAERVRTLKSEARARIKTPRQSGTVNEFVAVQRPDALHLETLDFFGKPVAVLATNGQRFALYNGQDSTFYSGPASAANVSRLLPLVLDPREAVMILLGEVPKLAAEQTRLVVDEQARAYLLTLASGAVTQRIWLGTEDLRPLRSEIRGARAYDVRFENYQLIDEVVFPVEISLVAVDERGTPTGVEIALKYQELELNPSLSPTLFHLDQPANTRFVEVDELGRPLGAGPDLPLPEQPGLPPGASPGR